jgi:hypothetical protein
MYIVWRLQMAQLYGLTNSSPAVADGNVYIGSSDDKVYCLDAGTGAFIWEYTTGGDVFSSPAVANGKLYVGSWDNKVYCLNSFTGGLVWRYVTNTDVDSSPAVANGKVYIGSYNYKLYCFGKTTVTPPPQNGGGYEPPSNIPLNMKPIADASAGEPYKGVINTNIIFNGSFSYDPDSDGYLIEWYWDFGDGTNDTGLIINHSYSKKGVYNVTLTVTDDDNDYDIYRTIVVISLPNKSPSKPIINGPITGHKNINYTYIVLSTDPNNDDIKYSCNWNDGSLDSSDFLQNGSSWMCNHSWIKAGKYIINVIATDNQTYSSSQKTIWIDSMNISNIGYIIDIDGDGTYDFFHNETNGNETALDTERGNYLIDENGDGKWDWIYNKETDRLTPFKEKAEEDYTLWYVLLLLIIIIMVYIVGRKNQNTIPKKPAIKKKKTK